MTGVAIESIGKGRARGEAPAMLFQADHNRAGSLPFPSLFAPHSTGVTEAMTITFVTCVAKENGDGGNGHARHCNRAEIRGRNGFAGAM
jgi:hypothetical protein